MRTRILLPILLACAFVPLPLRSATQTAAPSSSPPTLVVMLVVDQMRADYVEKYGRQWKGGLRRLIDRGAWFQNAVYPYAYTVTCAGHATISTGALPRTHGITGNAWWDRTSGKAVGCADDPAQQSISYGNPVQGGRGPAQLAIPTFTDELRAQSPAPPRIVTFSMKERTAIMLAGHGATAVTWYDPAVGSLVTSSAYATARVPFIERFLKAHPIESDLQTAWTPRQPPGFYAFTDAADGERPPSFWTGTFPHPLQQAGMKPVQTYGAWEESPFSDAYLERLGETAVEALDLGKGPATDYLGISFSALDLVGHDFGPQSHEVQDVLLRLDEDLNSLFAMLDRRLGRSGYLVALTADHGVSPIPEQMVSQGFAAGRIGTPTIARVQEALAAAAGGAKPAARSGGQFYLTAEARATFARDAHLREALAATLEQVPGIARVLFTDERGRWPTSDMLARAVRNTYYPDRAGDIYTIQQPYWLLGDSSAASHGTPYRYDTWVPLFLYGKGIKPGRYAQSVSPADVAPTLAWLCAMTLPDADGRPLVEAAAAPQRSRHLPRPQS
jgi:predicted AlkP superfamily pyrophosphatase or phosphodiesterase